MSTPQVKLIKNVDTGIQPCVRLPLTDDREFWLTQRQGLLIQLSSIERKLGIDRRCPHCGNEILKQRQG